MIVDFKSVDELIRRLYTESADAADLAVVGGMLISIGVAHKGNTVLESRDLARLIIGHADETILHAWDQLRQIPMPHGKPPIIPDSPGAKALNLAAEINRVLSGQTAMMKTAALGEAAAIVFAGERIPGDREKTAKLRAGLVDVFVRLVRDSTAAGAAEIDERERQQAREATG